jgi:uncharacterized damage-inducible protein DinB
MATNTTDTKRASNTATLSRPTRGVTGPHAKQFLNVFNREHALTLKVMQAFPASKATFQPHPRSQTAKRLMWTFVMSQDLVRAGLKGGMQIVPDVLEEPATLAEVIAAYEEGAREIAEQVSKSTDADLRATMPFLTGPSHLADVPLLDVMWMMLMDSIHHRGQLSVYVRMAGGLVPSIYGPSADEPWM